MDKNTKETEERKERIRTVKTYSRVINMFSSFIFTILLGVVIGYFCNKWFEGDNWIVICILVFFLIGVVNFYRQLLKIK